VNSFPCFCDQNWSATFNCFPQEHRSSQFFVRATVDYDGDQFAMAVLFVRENSHRRSGGFDNSHSSR